MIFGRWNTKTFFPGLDAICGEDLSSTGEKRYRVSVGTLGGGGSLGSLHTGVILRGMPSKRFTRTITWKMRKEIIGITIRIFGYGVRQL